ncbi:MAG: thioredoxin domain-containing protein [Thermodesulfovibrionales bacterium]|jgi:thioredoxin 2
MSDHAVFLRCKSCKTLNRVPAERLFLHPKCGKCTTLLEFPKTPVAVTARNFEEEVLKWPGTVLVEFWSPRCGICLSIAPVIERLAREKAGIVKIAMVEVEKEWLLANRFDIRSTPVFFVYRNGVKINELFGALPRLQLEAWLLSAVIG